MTGVPTTRGSCWEFSSGQKPLPDAASGFRKAQSTGGNSKSGMGLGKQEGTHRGAGGPVSVHELPGVWRRPGELEEGHGALTATQTRSRATFIGVWQRPGVVVVASRGSRGPVGVPQVLQGLHQWLAMESGVRGPLLVLLLLHPWNGQDSDTEPALPRALAHALRPWPLCVPPGFL